MHKTFVIGWERWMNPYHMRHETTVDGRDERRTTQTRWCRKCLFMDERNEGIHTESCTKQLLMNETNEVQPIPDYLQNTWWWTRQVKEFIQDDVRTTVDGWEQRRTTDTRWCIKQLSMDETDEWVHTRWRTKQLMMDEKNEGLPMPGDAQNNSG